jgi:hypothetical protein
MTILKHALLGTLKIVFLGSLKVALFVYALFLSDTTFAGAAPEGNGYHAGRSCAGNATRRARASDIERGL